MLFVKRFINSGEVIVFENDLRKERKLKKEHVPRRYELLQRALKDFSKSPENKFYIIVRVITSNNRKTGVNVEASVNRFLSAKCWTVNFHPCW